MQEWRPANGGHVRGHRRPVVVGDLNDSISALARDPAHRGAARHGRSRSALVFRAARGCCRSASRWRPPALTFGGARAGRRVADDGLDRRAAGAHRPRRRLRDPAAGARQEERRPGERDRGRASGRRCSARPTVVIAAAATAAGFPRSRCRPCRWCEASGCCSSRASRSPSPARCSGAAALAPARALDAARPRCAARRGAGAAWRGAGARPDNRAAPRQPPRRARRARALRLRDAPPGARARRARASRPPAGRSTPSARGVRHPEARPAGRRRCVTSTPAALDRCRRRGRRRHRGRRPHRPGGAQLDDRLPDGVLQRFGYSAWRGCGKAELCPAFSLPDLFRPGPAATRAPSRAARRRPAVLLAGRRQRRPAHGDAGVRHPPHAARPAEGGHRRDARAAPPAAGVAPSWPACPCSPPTPTPRSPRRRRMLTLLVGLLAVAPCSSRAARRRPRARAARPDRARDRLVGARALRDAHPAEPDVGRRSARS